MAPGKPRVAKGSAAAGRDVPLLPSVRSLAKSSSAPTNEQGWLAKLGTLFKSLSSLDSGSRDRAADAADHSIQQQRLPPARQLVVGMSAQRMANPRVHVGTQLHAPGGVSPKLAPLGTNRPRLSLVEGTPGTSAQGQQQHLPPRLPSPRPSRLESLKRMVSGMFQRHTPVDPVDQSLRAQLQQPLQPRPSPAMPATAHPDTASARTTPTPTAAAAAVARVSPLPQAVAVQPALPRPQPVRLPEAPSSSSVVRDSNSALTTMSTSPSSTATAAAAALASPTPTVQQGSNLLAISEHLPPAMQRRVWQIEDYSDLQQIHAGYASYVFKARCRLSGHTVALKIYQPDKLHEISQFQLLREARLHTHLNHPNVVRLYAAFQQEDGVVLVQEYADGGDLLQLLYECGSRLSERRTVRLVIEPLLKALHYLHSQSIIHRDIKLENILFTGPEMTLKLADFGLCLNLREERSVTRAGTLDYMAPEVLKCPTKNTPADNKERLDLAYNTSVDIWAVGVVAYELLNGVPPFTRKEREETERLIMKGAVPAFQVHVSDLAKEFIYSCLTRDGRSRPSAHQLLRFPWIKITARPNSGQTQSMGSRRKVELLAPGAHGALPAGKPSLAAGHAGRDEADEGDPPSELDRALEEGDRDTAHLPNALPEVGGLGDTRTSAPSVLAYKGQARVKLPMESSAEPSTQGRGKLAAAATAPAAVPLYGASSAPQYLDDEAEAKEKAAQAKLPIDGRSSASEMQSSKIRQLEYSALKSKNANEDKHVWMATVTYVNQLADSRRAGRQLQHQQAVVFQATAGTLQPEPRQQSLRWKEEDMLEVLEGAATSPKRRMDRVTSDLSRHTTDAGYRSAARSRRNSQSFDSQDIEAQLS